MALVTCPDCAAQVSDAAPACPKCGRPNGFGPAAVVQKVELGFWQSPNVGCAVVGVIVLVFAFATLAMCR